MSILLFRLNNVPEDEAEDIRNLLEENSIGYYETHAGFFGTSIAALWLKSKDQLERAKGLVAQYQSERSQRVREEYVNRLSAGEAESFWLKVKRQPVKIVLCLVVVAVVLYFSIMPFMWLAESRVF